MKAKFTNDEAIARRRASEKASKKRRTERAIERPCPNDSSHIIPAKTLRCNECFNAAVRARYHANLEESRAENAEKARQLRADNPEHYREKSTRFSRKFRAENPGYHAARQAEARALDPELHEARAKASAKAHPETGKAATHRKRARKKNARGDGMTRTQWLEIVEEQNGQCAQCNEVKPLTPDHVVPLTKDGMHDISNILGLCISCNSKKWHYMPKVENFQPWARAFVRATIKWHKDNPLPPAPAV